MGTNSTKPARLINGRTNPEYTRWYRTTEKGKECVKKWNASEKAKASMKKYKQKPETKAKAKMASKEYHQKPEVKKKTAKTRSEKYHRDFPFGHLTCAKCRKPFCKEVAVIQNWPRIGWNYTMCETCV